MWEGRMGPPLPEGKGNTDRARREEAKRISLGPVTSIKWIFSVFLGSCYFLCRAVWVSNPIRVEGMAD